MVAVGLVRVVVPSRGSPVSTLRTRPRRFYSEYSSGNPFTIFAVSKLTRIT